MNEDMEPYESALPPTEEKPRKWRREKYEELGFSYELASKLADTRDAKGFFLYWGDVKALLDQGCDLLTAFDIFSEGDPELEE